MYQRRPYQLSTLRSFWNVEFYANKFAYTWIWRREKEYTRARAATLADFFLSRTIFSLSLFARSFPTKAIVDNIGKNPKQPNWIYSYVFTFSITFPALTLQMVTAHTRKFQRKEEEIKWKKKKRNRLKFTFDHISHWYENNFFYGETRRRDNFCFFFRSRLQAGRVQILQWIFGAYIFNFQRMPYLNMHHAKELDAVLIVYDNRSLCRQHYVSRCICTLSENL